MRGRGRFAESADLRRAFTQRFVAWGHHDVPSSSLVPADDPTLLFVNSGMVPFKNLFTGRAAPPPEWKRPRAVSVQKCVRAGGKHNDLDNVGRTARHHTFFEMLGNFSFGDYFKEEAVSFAWTFLTECLDLPADRLLVTVHAGDDRTRALWRAVSGLPDRRIVSVTGDGNFWSMGDTGPCGPCTEVFFDHGEDVPGGVAVDTGPFGDRFIEIWNVVFMESDARSDGTRVPLPTPCVDTGMGLERVAAVVQGRRDTYDTDLISALVEAAGACADGAMRGVRATVACRVIADHVRAISFLIADGVFPSNEGRGYVLRRIMRRAMRHAHALDARNAFLWRLTSVLTEAMGAAYPELVRAEDVIVRTLRGEEDRFREALSRGLRILEDEIHALDGTTFPGEIAFRLHDTYGFPLDLTRDALAERGLNLDERGFAAAMDRQRAEARSGWTGSGATSVEATWFALHRRLGAPDFVGHRTDRATGIVRAVLIGDDLRSVDHVGPGEDVAFLTDRTPFYAEGGGQIGDVGRVDGGDGLVIDVTGVTSELRGLHVIRGRIRAGRLRVGVAVEQRVDARRRAAVSANHSATHLLHASLRRVLGSHVVQKGSSVDGLRLRFDFVHSQPLSAEELDRIEEMVNAVVRANDEVSIRTTTRAQAEAAGALAPFGETYGAQVRMLAIGRDPEDVDAARPFSLELCGGTHVRRSGDIGLFKIVSEGSVGSGIRRIEARTGAMALAYVARNERILRMVTERLKIGGAVTELPNRIAALLDERTRLERKLAEARRMYALGDGSLDDVARGLPIRRIGDVAVMVRCVADVPLGQPRETVLDAESRIGSGVVAFVAVDGGKAGMAVGVTENLRGHVDAVSLARAGGLQLGGRGGGGDDVLAQSGGPRADNWRAALDAVIDAVRNSGDTMA